MASGKSFWKDYARQHGTDALPPAGRRALGLEEPPSETVRERKVTIYLSGRHLRMLGDAAREAGVKPAALAGSFVRAVLEDDYEAHGGAS